MATRIASLWLTAMLGLCVLEGAHSACQQVSNLGFCDMVWSLPAPLLLPADLRALQVDGTVDVPSTTSAAALDALAHQYYAAVEKVTARQYCLQLNLAFQRTRCPSTETAFL